MNEAVHASVTVPVGPEPAFDLFVGELASWWPHEYSWSQEVLEGIGIEPREGGLCSEWGPHGFRCDWGRVLAWDPPRRLLIAWQISPRREPEPNPAKASEVEIRFGGDGDGRTIVELEHRAFDRHGDDGGEYAEMLGAPQGWPYILDRFAATCAARTSA
jgi:uncharacterized protein YndB with AHSA1/START domain